MKNIIKFLLLVMTISTVSGCAASAHKGVMDSDVNQVAIRQIQSRMFEMDNQEKALRAVIATLQDLGFIIDKVSFELGTVSGTKLSGYQLKMTVNVTSIGTEQIAVRANAQYNITPVTDPIPYQNFFNALAKSLFLEANLMP